MGELWGITCYFNPVGYKRRLQNYHLFRRHLTIPLITVELAYRDDFDLPPGAADKLIRLRSSDVLWQKERLLNLALAALPDRCDAVAWLDCDVVFEDDDWAARAEQALQRFPLIQPFQTVREIKANDTWDKSSGAPGDTPLGPSLAYALSQGAVTSEMLRGNMRLKKRNTGLAWLARREVLDHDGFYDACIMGSGNRAMLCGALGMPDDAVHYLQMATPWAEHYRAWAEKHFRSLGGGGIGYIDGELIHLWHGDLVHRRYQERHREFSGFAFDPTSDIALDEEACWRWSSPKPEMHEYVARYFRERREDGA
jgi:hypothetical protein